MVPILVAGAECLALSAVMYAAITPLELASCSLGLLVVLTLWYVKGR